MDPNTEILLAIGGLLLLSLLTDILGTYTFLPRVTLLLLLGILIGPEMIDLIPNSLVTNFELIADIALIMIGFLLGGKLTRSSFEQFGKQIVYISLSAVAATFIFVFAGLYLVGVPFEAAVLISCIATATAPAATSDVVTELKKKSRFSELLLAIVAIDDAWALIIFSVGVSVVLAVSGDYQFFTPIQFALYDIGVACFVGVLLGLPAAYATGRLDPGQPNLAEALGLVLLCGGIAMWLEVSFLISSMVLGSVIANLAKHHEYAFHEIEYIEWPFLVVFFVLAGASLEFESVGALGLVGVTYIACRILGKVSGAALGARLSASDHHTARWMGAAMLPQAGASMGMALIAAHSFPEHSQIILSVIIGATVIFELVGPFFTRQALNRDPA